MDNFLVKNYKVMLDTSSSTFSEWERVKGRMGVDILVQYAKIDEFFNEKENKEGINHNWNEYKSKYKQFMDKLRDCNENDKDWVRESGIEHLNTLFVIQREIRLEEQKGENKKKKSCWDLFQIVGKIKTITESAQLLDLNLQMSELMEMHKSKIVELIEKEKRENANGNDNEDSDNDNEDDDPGNEWYNEERQVKFTHFLCHELDAEGKMTLAKLTGTEFSMLESWFVIICEGSLNPKNLFLNDVRKMIRKYKSFLEDPNKWNGKMLKDFDLEANIFYYKHNIIGKLLDMVKELENIQENIKLEDLEKEFLTLFGQQKQMNNSVLFCEMHMFLQKRIINKYNLLKEEKWEDEIKRMGIGLEDTEIEDCHGKYGKNEIDENLKKKYLPNIHQVCLIELLEQSAKSREFFATNKNLRLIKLHFQMLTGRKIMHLVEKKFGSKIFDIDEAEKQYLIRNYTTLLMENDDERRDAIKQELDLYGAIWYWKNAYKKIQIESQKDFKTQIQFGILNIELESILEREAASEGPKQLCQIYKFITNIIMTNKSVKIDKNLRNKLHSQLTKPLKDDTCEKQDIMKKIVNELLKSPRMKETHFLFFINNQEEWEDELDKIFGGISGAADEQQQMVFNQRQARLIELVGIQQFGNLQKYFPANFHFEELSEEILIKIYWEILTNREGSEASRHHEMWLCLSFLVKQMMNLEQRINRMIKEQMPNENGLFIVLLNSFPRIYGNIFSSKPITKDENLCIAYKNNTYLNSLIKENEGNSFGNDDETAIERIASELYEGINRITRECEKYENNRYWEEAFNGEQGIMREWHLEKLDNFLGEEKLDKDTLMKYGGVKYRIVRLVGEKEGNELIGKHELQFTGAFQDKEPKQFLSQLWSAVTSPNISEQIANKLALNSFAIIEWIDEELTASDDSKETWKMCLAKVKEAWNTCRVELVEEYEQLCDIPANELGKLQVEVYYRKIRLAQLRKYIYKKIMIDKKLGSMGKLRAELDDIMKYKNVHKIDTKDLSAQIDVIFIEKMKNLLKDNPDFLNALSIEKSKFEHISKKFSNESLSVQIAEYLTQQEEMYFKPIYSRKTKRNVRKKEEMLKTVIKQKEIGAQKEKQKSIVEVQNAEESEQTQIADCSASAAKEEHDKNKESAKEKPKKGKSKKQQKQPQKKNKKEREGELRRKENAGKSSNPRKEQIDHAKNRSAKIQLMIDELGLPAAEEQIRLKDFIVREELLAAKYMEFILRPDERKRPLLEVGALIREMWHRMDNVEHLLLKVDQQNGIKIRAKIGEMRENIRQEWNRPVEEAMASEINRKNYYGLLKKLIHFKLESDDDDDEEEEGKQQLATANEEGYALEEESKFRILVKKLHWNNLANAIFLDNLRIVGKMTDEEEREQIEYAHTLSCWYKMTNEEKRSAFVLLFGAGKSGAGEMVEQFNVHIFGWREMREQMEMDQEIGGKLISPLYFQEIDQEKEKGDLNSEALINLLISEKALIGQGPIEDTVNSVRALINEWDNDSRLLISGSYALNLYTDGSDVDCIVLLSEQNNKSQNQSHQWQQTQANKQRFFGTLSSECNLDLKGDCQEEESLFCQLCNHPKVTFLRKLPVAVVPLIKMKFDGIEFDLQFVSVPGEILETFPTADDEGEPDIEAIDQHIGRFIVHVQQLPFWDYRNEKSAMFRSLSSYRSAIKMRDLLGNFNNYEYNNFRTTLLALKHWAKKHFLYKAGFGFFSGIMLSVLVCKVCLLYPGATVPFLIEQFFILITTWNWPTQIQLENPDRESISKSVDWKMIDWNPELELRSREKIVKENEKDSDRLAKHAKLIWQILTPGFPTQNSAFYVNHSSAQIMRKECLESLKKIREIRNFAINNSRIKNDALKFAWKKWLQSNAGEKFYQKFDIFFLVTCVMKDKQTNSSFCDFADKGIRHQLVLKLEGMKGIQFCHPSNVEKSKIVCPDFIKKEIRKNRSLPFFKQPFCTFWLVGIEKTKENVKIDVDKEKMTDFDKTFNQSSGNGQSSLPQNAFIKTFFMGKSKIEQLFNS